MKVVAKQISELETEAAELLKKARGYMDVYDVSKSPVNLHYFVVEADILFKAAAEKTTEAETLKAELTEHKTMA